MSKQVRYIVVFGVSGSGKTTVGKQLAERFDLAFIEGDDLHPKSNIAKMTRGHALNDEDRTPWLHHIAEKIKLQITNEEGFVLSCSALKVKYRNILRQAGSLQFIFLSVHHRKLRQRLSERENHFMPPLLLESQLETLELPTISEQDVFTIDASVPLKTLLSNILIEFEKNPQ